MLRTLYRHRELIVQLTLRDIQTRYRGSLLGFFWSFLTPLLMLGVYTFVFGSVFNSRWSNETVDRREFALILFCGLTIYGVFAETLSRAPGVLIANPNYIKRVVFPLEILPVTVLGSAIVNGLISLIALLAVVFALTGGLQPTIFLLPIVILPLLLLALGCAWFLSALGVYLRDIGQVVPIAVSALMFLSPIFYPISAVPAGLRPYFALNPVAYVVEDARRVVLWGSYPLWSSFLLNTLIGALFALLGYLWFQKTKRGFADVV